MLNEHPLKTDLIGRVVLRDEPGYSKSRRLFNKAIDKHPAAIAYCWGAADVITCIEFARSEGMKISVRSGGCSITGFSSNNDGLVIDTSQMKAAIVNPLTEELTVEPGVVWSELYPELEPSGLIIPGGECPMVAVGGLTLGGGLSLLGRSMGITSDGLTGAHIVTADGKLRVANEHVEPDLFWALRGGGGGNFGVVTALHFRLQPIREKLATAFIQWPLESTADVGEELQEYLFAEAPDELGGLFMVTPELPESGRCFAAVLVYNGPVEEGRAAIERVSRIGKPLEAAVRVESYNEFVNASFQAPRQLFYEFWKSSFLARPMPREGLTTLVEALEDSPSPGNFAGFELVGGAVNRVAPDATAFVHRDQFSVFSIFANSQTPGDGNKVWANNLYSELRPHTSGKHYQNYPDRSLENWSEAYYGPNYPRLQQVKAKYDPDNVFRFRQSIRLPGEA